jgi:dCTP deaminase
MATSAPRLFAGEPDEPADALHATGLLPSQHLRGLIEHSREIRTLVPIEPEQLQPASLDLRLGASAWRVRASFLPGAAASVQEKIEAFAMHRFDLGETGTVLEKGCVYIVELLESLALKKRTSAIANPKSSIGCWVVHSDPPSNSGDNRMPVTGP